MTTTISGINQMAVQMDCMSMSKYEFLQELRPAREVEGMQPSYLREPRIENTKLAADEQALVGTEHANGAVKTVKQTTTIPPQQWMVRRRRDEKLFLVRQFIDPGRYVHEAKETLLRLLNHPNLINLIDVVHDQDVVGGEMNYMVWEYCDKGTLNRLLWPGQAKQQVEIPESLCWHVLDGISQALLWLHFGHKDTFPFDRHMGHDDDWHPILIMNITPTNIYFCAPEGLETYGDVKLGNFASATVHSMPRQCLAPTTKKHRRGRYQPPEIRENLEGWSMASEVWLLGAVLYHMMVGRPPLETQKELAPLAPDGTKPSDILVQALPTKYSSELREIVTEMLRTRTQERPTTPELSLSVDRGMRIWCESTPEGRLYVRKGQRKGNSGLVPREALSLGRLR